MVLLQIPSCISPSSVISNQLCMESRNIPFVAPLTLDSSKTNECHSLVLLAKEKRLLFGDSNKEIERWNGVNEFCQTLDAIVETQKETAFFEGKRVLEIGFSTGLPSIYALQHNAKDVTVVYSTEEALKTQIEPTMFQNEANERVSYVIGDIEDIVARLGNQKYDIILAPEIVYTKEKNFEKIHSVFESLLKMDGMILLSGRSHYHNCNGNMSTMVDLIKKMNKFDIVDRTVRSQRYETAPRKFYQLMHKWL